MNVRFTTTIYAFCVEINNLWNVYTDNGGIISVPAFSGGIVLDHINGVCIPYNEPWCKVDYVLMPISIKSEHHWVLGVLSFKSRSIAVYDSMCNKRHDSEVLKGLKPFQVLLPLFLDAYGVLSDRTDIFDSTAWKNKKITDPSDVVLIGELPQQDNGIDCGLFVSCFAEYFTLNLPPPPIGFKAISHRERYATLLWAYASNKQALSISSDGENKNRRGKKPL